MLEQSSSSCFGGSEEGGCTSPFCRWLDWLWRLVCSTSRFLWPARCDSFTSRRCSTAHVWTTSFVGGGVWQSCRPVCWLDAASRLLAPAGGWAVFAGATCFSSYALNLQTACRVYCLSLVNSVSGWVACQGVIPCKVLVLQCVCQGLPCSSCLPSQQALHGAATASHGAGVPCLLLCFQHRACAVTIGNGSSRLCRHQHLKAFKGRIATDAACIGHDLYVVSACWPPSWPWL